MLVLYIWRAAVLCRAAAASRLVSSGLISRFPFVFSWIAASILRSLILMANVWPRHDVIIATAPLLLALQFAATVETFRESTKRHRFGAAGSWILAAAALAGIGCSAASLFLSLPPVVYGIYWATLAERHGALVMVVVLAVTLAILEHFRRDIPVDRLAYRAVVLMLASATGEMLFASLNVATRFQVGALTNVLPVAFDGCVSALWATWFVAARRYTVLPILHPGRATLAAGIERLGQREAGLRRLRRAILTTVR